MSHQPEQVKPSFVTRKEYSCHQNCNNLTVQISECCCGWWSTLAPILVMPQGKDRKWWIKQPMATKNTCCILSNTSLKRKKWSSSSTKTRSRKELGESLDTWTVISQETRTIARASQVHYLLHGMPNCVEIQESEKCRLVLDWSGILWSIQHGCQNHFYQEHFGIPWNQSRITNHGHDW